MVDFVGRDDQLGALSKHLDIVRARTGPSRGACVLIRGRRRVGKSRLVEEFIARAGIPSVFYAATKKPAAAEVASFVAEVADSDLPGRGLVSASNPADWDAALRVLAASLDDDDPAIVVIDELPYLLAAEDGLDATFQKAWDRYLSKKPVLLILVGSDLAMMEELGRHGAAFYQRGTEMVVPPLSPAETAEIVGIADPADAFDAYLVTGGLPLIALEWSAGMSLMDYLTQAVSTSTSALVVSAERVLAAEFPETETSRAVLEQIGNGEVTFSKIGQAAGGLQPASLSRSLTALLAKRIVSKDLPLSTKPSNEARYRATDPYLRFWLRFIGPHLGEIERGRGDRIIRRVEQDWTTWRGRAVEPILREALNRLLPTAGLSGGVVGSYWTRSNVPEIDVIGADRGPIAKKVTFIGTIRWLEHAELDQRDMDTLASHVDAIPGAGPKTPLVAISRAGVSGKADVALGPADLLAAWTSAATP